jgi:pimeloyl-ACP methyl ester carboxylesterase
MASFGVKVIRGAFWLGERVAPPIAGWAAFELFRRTPGQRALTVGERKAIASAASFMDEARRHRLRTRTDCVTVHEFRPATGAERRGTVLVVHGWRSRTEYMRAIIEGLRKAGFRVMSLDLPGHGASRGRRLDLVRAVDAVRTADIWFGPFDAIVGHSFGGVVALNARAGSIEGISAVDAARLVLISVPESIPEIFDQYGRLINVGPRSQNAIASRVERIAGRPITDFTGARQLREIGAPTLVIHAVDDREVHADSAHRHASAGAHVDLVWVDGAGHRRILADPHTVDATVRFSSGKSAAARRSPEPAGVSLDAC